MLAGLIDAIVESPWGRDFAGNLLNATIPRGGYRVVRDITYGDGAWRKLDVYVPKGLKGPAPVVLFIFGGGWEFGTKKIYRFLAEAFTSAGIVTAVADYRLYPEARYPDFLEDNALAFRFLHERAAEFGGDPERLFLAGHSAGAYNAVMLAADPRYLGAPESEALKGVIGISGLYDFLPLTSPVMIDLFGGDNVRETQPIEYVDRKMAPMLLAHGSLDDVVDPGNSRRMAAKLSEFGSEVVLREFADAGHTDILVSLARGFRGRTTLRQDIITFIRAH